MGELPHLDARRCTGCGDCVAVCPTDCLAMSESRPWLPRPDDCIACAACEVVCPTEAIALAITGDLGGRATDASPTAPR